MTGLQLFAAAGMPILIIVLAGAAVLLHSWTARHRQDGLRPGE
jgi:hypothetical protein